MIDDQDAIDKLTKTDKKAKDTSGTFSKMAGGAAKVGAAVYGIGAAAVTGLSAMATKTAEAGDRVDKMSQKIGLSREGFQEWDYIMSQSGMSIDTMQGGMKTLVNSLDDMKKGGKIATDAFNRIGLSLDDLEGKSQEDIFEMTLAGIQGVADETERAALANDLFGRSGSELAPLLNTSASAIGRLKQQAHEMGMVMGDEAIDNAVVLGDTLDMLKRTGEGLMNTLGAALMPVLQSVLDTIVANVPFIQSMIETLAPVLSSLFEQLLPPLLELAEKLLPVLLALIEPLLPLLEPLLALLQPFIDLLFIILEPLIEMINMVLPPLTALLTVLAGTISDILGPAFEDIKPILDGVKLMFGGLIDFIKNVFTGDWKGAWDGIVDIFSGIWDTMKAVFKAPINWIIDGINRFIRGVNKIKIPDWVPSIGGKGINIKEIPRLKVGMDYVPFDEFPAILHKGERVMTAEENERFSNGGASTVYNIYLNNMPAADSDKRKLAQYIEDERRRGLMARGLVPA